MKAKALFLDRDGVINEERDYVHRTEDFVFMDGIFSLLRYAQSQDYRLVVITNQAGIARGYYSEEVFHGLTDWMIEQFARRDVRIDRVYFCPYHATHGQGKYLRDSPCRKPAPGMILQAVEELRIDVARSVLVGDKESDIEAGRRAGVGNNILLKSSRYVGASTQADRVVNTLNEIPPLL